MKRAIAATTTVFAVVVGISAPAYADGASTEQAELTTTDLKMATDDFWTPKRIEMAMANSELVARLNNSDTKSMHSNLDSYTPIN